MSDDHTAEEIEDQAKDLVWHYGFEWKRLPEEDRVEFREMAKRVLSRDELAQCVWGDAALPFCASY